METWPDGFMDIGGLTFDEVYERKKEFVEFTLTSMTKCSGMFKRWQQFCEQKENDQKRSGNYCGDDLYPSKKDKKDE